MICHKKNTQKTQHKTEMQKYIKLKMIKMIGNPLHAGKGLIVEAEMKGEDLPVGKCIREVGGALGREGSSVERASNKVSKRKGESSPERNLGGDTQEQLSFIALRYWSGPKTGQTGWWMSRTLQNSEQSCWAQPLRGALLALQVI